MPSKPKTGVKKLVSVLVTSTPVTATRKEAFETAETIDTIGAGKDSEKSKGSKYLGNLA